MAMEDTTTKARGKKPTILKKKGGTTHSTSPRRKRLEEEEDEDLPLPSYRNTSVQALYGLFTKAQANISGGVGQQQLAGEGRSDHLRQLAEGVEKGVFEQHGNPVHSHEPTRAYGQQLRTLRYNILQNKDLQARILTGSLSAAAIARLTPEEMLTTTAREEQQEKEAKAHDMLRLDRHLAPQVEEELAARRAGGGLTCGVCGSDKVGLMHRYNALEDEQQRRVEMACNVCGATMVQMQEG